MDALMTAIAQILMCATIFAVSLHLYFVSLGMELQRVRDSCKLSDELFGLKFYQFLATETVQVTMRGARHSVVAGNAVTQIYFLSQADLADQLQISPDGAVADRTIRCPYFVIELVHGHVGTEFKEGPKHELSLGCHFEPFGFQELFHRTLFFISVYLSTK